MPIQTKSISVKTLEKALENKEFVKVLQLIGTQYDTTSEHFLLVEAYLGLGRFDLAEKLLINWQSKLLGPEEWANWCYLYAKSLLGMKNKVDALTTLSFATDFLKVIENDELKRKIDDLKKEIETIF